MRANIANFVAFQAAWLACVLGAARGAPWLGPAFVLAWLVVHLQVMDKIERRVEWRLMIVAAALGYGVDTMLLTGGRLVFPPDPQAADSPLWMVALWIGFAATLARSLRWLDGRYLLAAGLGLAGGPAAYWAGARLGAVELTAGSVSMLWIAAAWAVALPLLILARAVLARSVQRSSGEAFGPQGLR